MKLDDIIKHIKSGGTITKDMKDLIKHTKESWNSALLINNKCIKLMTGMPNDEMIKLNDKLIKELEDLHNLERLIKLKSINNE